MNGKNVRKNYSRRDNNIVIVYWMESITKKETKRLDIILQEKIDEYPGKKGFAFVRETMKDGLQPAIHSQLSVVFFFTRRLVSPDFHFRTQ